MNGKEGNVKGSSPSWFNALEAITVVHYIKQLLDDRSFGLSPADIGIITPYLRQVRKIRSLLTTTISRRYYDTSLLKIGTVEEFQGSERKVIIISTVRSQQISLAFDSKYKTWFCE